MNKLATNDLQKTRYIPLTRFNEFYPWPSVAALKHLCYRRHQNGFSVCVVKKFNKLFIDEAAFHIWMQEGKENLELEKD